MRAVLDTHVVLWWLSGPDQLAEAARRAIEDPENEVWLSAVVVWEIEVKKALGKLSMPQNFRDVLARERFEELAVTVAHAHRLAHLPVLHRDPFDRMLVAQAIEEDATLITRDARLAGYPVRILEA